MEDTRRFARPERRERFMKEDAMKGSYAVFAVALSFLVAFFSGPVTAANAQTMNGFDLSGATVERSEILSGGPGRDGIPSIDNPKFVATGEVDYLLDDDIVIGIVRGNDARAYPLRILVWHEIVNDLIGGEALAVTYCPLCGTGMVFDRRAGGTTRTFGVSGLLYRSDVLMYDRETESLWSQLAMEAVSGPAAGAKLEWLPSEQLTWKAWRGKYPGGRVLSIDTGHRRNYAARAYASYFDSDETMFPVPRNRTELKEKAWVVGIIVNGQAKAYPIDLLPAKKTVRDTVGGVKIAVRYDPEKQHPQVTGPEGDDIPSVTAFWFAWQAFYPDTDLWKP